MRISAALAVLLSLTACDRSGGGGSGSGGAASDSPFADAPPASPLLQPFAGQWQFHLDKTLAAWKAAGVPAAEIAAAEKMKGAPYPLHADMSIQGNVAVLKGSPEGEYFFFGVHPHGQWVCGKAWHHEDRHDPGEMSKCYVRLELKDQELHLSVRMEDGGPNPNDPDLTKLPAAAGSAGTCRADAAPDPPWSKWETYVFVRGK